MSSIDVVFNLINKMSPGVQKIGQDVDKLNSKIKSVGNNANSLGSKGKGVSGLSSVFNGLNLTLLAVGAAFTKLGSDIYKNTTEFQNYETQLTTLTGSMGKAAIHADQIKKLAKETPFEFKDLAKTDQQFLALGLSTEEAYKKVKLLSSVTAGVGNSPEKLATVSRVQAQSMSKNKVEKEDLNQLADAGLPIYTELAKTLKVSGAELNKMVSAGKVGPKELSKTYERMIQKGGIFYGAAEAQSKTLSGQVSNISDTYSQAAAQIGNALMSSVNIDFSFITNGIDTIKEGIISAIDPALKIFETLKPAITSISNLMKTMFSSVDASAFFDVIDKGADIISSIVTIVGDGLSGIFSSLTESGYFESFKGFFDNIYRCDWL
jgi:tape measure domain-containing protein